LLKHSYDILCIGRDLFPKFSHKFLLNGSYKRWPDNGRLSEAETCCLIDLYMVFCPTVYREIYTPEDEATTVLQSIRNYLPIHKASHPSRLESLETLLWQLKSHTKLTFPTNGCPDEFFMKMSNWSPSS
jgi:hypothetical protein